MRIIRLAFKETCPHCKHQTDTNGDSSYLVCENCGGGWNSSIYFEPYQKQNPFKNPPIPQGNDRRIRPLSPMSK